jgi:hypothetical protein
MAFGSLCGGHDSPFVSVVGDSGPDIVNCPVRALRIYSKGRTEFGLIRSDNCFCCLTWIIIRTSGLLQPLDGGRALSGRLTGFGQSEWGGGGSGYVLAFGQSAHA